MWRRIGFGLLAVALGALGGCDSGTRGSPAGAYCYENVDCLSGVCEFGVCALVCTTDEDCAGNPDFTGTCGSDGRCELHCEGERVSWDGTSVCLGGRETACATLDDSYCDICDGKCTGQRCVASVGCAPLSEVGEECTQDRDCRTNNCSLFAGVCRVPLETACDDTNCDVCISNAAGWSYCSRECGSDVDAPACPGNRCLGDTSYNYFHCRPACNDACPGRCAYSSGGTSFCDEQVYSDWSESDPPRPFLAPCRYDSQCAEGTCLNAPSCDSRSYDCLGSRGYCTVACASDADCGDAAHCVQVTCPAGVTEGCGMLCLPSCDISNYGRDCSGLADARCRTLPSASGGSVAVCDPRNDEGSYCRTGLECASGTCSSSDRCSASGGSPNGSSCGTGTDCASNNCQGGTCRGTALRGDPCTSTYDCSAGTCTSGICD